MSWSAKQYVAFEDERNRPIRDLLAALPAIQARRVIDLGCGPGNSTQLLAQCFPEAQVRGLDSSLDMLEAARRRLPEAHFERLSIEHWREPGPFDVILANAVLQWLPDHERLLPSLAARLAPGGSLAIQMPDNLEEPAHRVMREVAAEGPWAVKLAHVARLRTALLDAQSYYSILRQTCARVEVWRTTYHNALAGGVATIVEWFQGSGLRPFLQPLDDIEREQYLQCYTARLTQAYPVLADGTVLLPFPRLFIVATR